MDLTQQEYEQKLNKAGGLIKANQQLTDEVCADLPDATLRWLHRLYMLEMDKRAEAWNKDAERGGQKLWDALEAPVKPILQFSDLADMPVYEWLEEGFLPASGISIIYGKRGSGKSLFSFYLCAKYATEGHKTLYVATEGMRSVYPRGKACVAVNGLDWDLVNENFRFYNFESLPTPRLDDVDSASRMIEIASALKPNLVVFDIFGDTFSGDENSKEGMDAPLEAASKICHALDCSVVLVHHAGKESTRGARGHSRLEDKAEVVIRVHADPNEANKGFVYVSCEKMREAEPFERKTFKIEQNDASAAFKPMDGVKLPKVLTGAQKGVYEYVAKEPYKTFTDVVSNVNFSRGAIGKALQALIASGEIYKTENKRYVIVDKDTAAG